MLNESKINILTIDKANKRYSRIDNLGNITMYSRRGESADEYQFGLIGLTPDEAKIGYNDGMYQIKNNIIINKDGINLSVENSDSGNKTSIALHDDNIKINGGSELQMSSGKDVYINGPNGIILNSQGDINLNGEVLVNGGPLHDVIADAITTHDDNNNAHESIQNRIDIVEDDISRLEDKVANDIPEAISSLQSKVNKNIVLPTWNASTYTLSFKTTDSTGSLVIDLPLESLAKDLDFDPLTNELIIYKQDGTTLRISMSALIDIYTGGQTAEITTSVSTGKVITSTLRDNSIAMSRLTTALQDLINGKVDKVNAVTGVKGNAESTYRTGNVNLTADNVGAENRYIISSSGLADYVQYVIPLICTDNTNIGANATISGRLFGKRINGSITFDTDLISFEKIYNSSLARFSWISLIGTTLKPCKFTYNGLIYYGICTTDTSSHFGYIELIGTLMKQTIGQENILKIINYYNINTLEVINVEVKNSLELLTANITGAQEIFSYNNFNTYGYLRENNQRVYNPNNKPTPADIGAQPTLVSGTNIKTINNQSLLGSGNINVSGSLPVDNDGNIFLNNNDKKIILKSISQQDEVESNVTISKDSIENSVGSWSSFKQTNFKQTLDGFVLEAIDADDGTKSIFEIDTDGVKVNNHSIMPLVDVGGQETYNKGGIEFDINGYKTPNVVYENVSIHDNWYIKLRNGERLSLTELGDNRNVTMRVFENKENWNIEYIDIVAGDRMGLKEPKIYSLARKDTPTGRYADTQFDWEWLNEPVSVEPEWDWVTRDITNLNIVNEREAILDIRSLSKGDSYLLGIADIRRLIIPFRATEILEIQDYKGNVLGGFYINTYSGHLIIEDFVSYFNIYIINGNRELSEPFIINVTDDFDPNLYARFYDRYENLTIGNIINQIQIRRQK